MRFLKRLLARLVIVAPIGLYVCDIGGCTANVLREAAGELTSAADDLDGDDEQTFGEWLDDLFD